MYSLFVPLDRLTCMTINFAMQSKSFSLIIILSMFVLIKLDTVFNMKRPYDLVAFMRQEERSGMLEKLKDELLSRKDEIDKNEDRDTGMFEKKMCFVLICCKFCWILLSFPVISYIHVCLKTTYLYLRGWGSKVLKTRIY